MAGVYYARKMIDSDYLFRGNTLEDMNELVFDDMQINGNTFPIYSISTSEDEVDGDEVLYKRVDDLPYDVTETAVDITGGVTPALGTAFNLNMSTREQHVIIIIDSNEVSNDLRPIEYNIDFMQANEGVLPRIDTLTTGEVRVNGKIAGLTKDRTVNGWGDGALERAGYKSYSTEQELFRYGKTIDVSGAIRGVLSIYGSEMTPKPESVYNSVTRNKDVKYDTSMYISSREAVERLYDMATDQLPQSVVSGYRIIVTKDPQKELRKESQFISRSDFEYMYDGERFIEDYDLLGQYAGNLPE